MLDTDNIGSDTKDRALSSSEKQIILELGKKGLLSGYYFHLGGHRTRKSYDITQGWTTTKAKMSSRTWLETRKRLIDLSIIELVKRDTEFRGKGKDLYWLTDGGVLLAFILGADISYLEQLHEKIREVSDDMRYFYELTKKLPKNKIANIWSLTLFPLNPYISKQMLQELPHSNTKLTKREEKIVAETLKKYPNTKAYKTIKDIKRRFDRFYNFVENFKIDNQKNSESVTSKNTGEE